MDKKIPFGLKNGEIVDISQVESGINCNCLCPNCGSQLIAKKGLKTRHHFAHYNSEECKGAYETAIHLMSKKILEKYKRISLPKVDLTIGVNGCTNYTLYRENVIEFDSVQVEQKLQNTIPDIVLIKSGRKLAVEIAVTHFVDDLKTEKIKDHKTSTIEIDLSKEIKNIDEEYLTDILINKLENKKWIFNNKADKFYKRITNYAIPLELQSRGFTVHVDNCPLNVRIWRGQPYANFIDDCHDCTYYFNKIDNNKIFCLGANTKEVETILQSLN